MKKDKYVNIGNYNVDILGGIIANNNINVNCKVIGNIKCNKSVMLGKHADVTGDINAVNIIIYGEVTGNITASNTVTLCKGAVVHGDITTSYIVIDAGAWFSGECNTIQEIEEQE